MGTFRSLSTRQSADTALFTDGLGEGEWIRYWTRLPHSAAQAIASAAARPKVDRRGRIEGIDFDAGAAAAKRLQVGIVDWHILDEAGGEVTWNQANAATLFDGLPTEVVDELAGLVGKNEPDPALSDDAPDDGLGPAGEKVGEDSAASLPTSLAAKRKRRTG